MYPIRLFLLLLFLSTLVLLAGRHRLAAQSIPTVTAPTDPVLPPVFTADDLPSRAQELQPPPGVRVVKYGVNFITSAAEPADALRYANAAQTGAKWDRFPFYWHTIEQNADQFDFSDHDPVVIADIEEGLLVNAILMGIPGFYFRDGKAVPNTLYEPVFSDGSDVPAPGKSININNKWARFVYTTVQRYKPNGVIARQHGWPSGAGISQWEIWNEPDLPWFWDGSKSEYARLLKVAYLAVNHADPPAQVIFGAVANNFDPQYFDYYKDVLTILRSDPSPPRAVDQNDFHDILATHSYYNSWQTWYHVYRAREAMWSVGIEKPIWLNETGVSVWNDYPGPNWAPESAYRATLSEQADYVIQSTFYALFAGAEGIFHFQLYDGCGNQPQGTDFPPHGGELCTADGNYIHDQSKPCWGDAHGFFRNGRDAACFRQHPQPETARPALDAYRLVTQYLQDVVPLNRYKVCSQLGQHDGQEWIAFYRPQTNQRIMALWSCNGSDQLAVVPALESGALLLTPDGTGSYIAPTNGNYYLTLPAATNRNYPNPNPNFWPLGGRPYILVERDLQPPTVSVNASETQAGINLSWWADDGSGSGVASYDVLVSVDGGPTQTWISHSTQQAATYSGAYQYGVLFTVVARDQGNNERRATALIGTLPPADPPTVAKTVNIADAVPGQTLHYRITVTNPSQSVALNDVALSDAVPWPLQYISNSVWTSHGSAEVTANGSLSTITWQGALTPRQTLILTFHARLPQSVDTDMIVTNKVDVDYGGPAPQTARAMTVVGEVKFENQIYLPVIRQP